MKPLPRIERKRFPAACCSAAVYLTVSLLAAPAHAQYGAVPAKQVEKAEQAYLAGARLLDHKDLAGAQVEFARATNLNPTRRDYALALDLARQGEISSLVQQAANARVEGNSVKADELLAKARIIDPKNDLLTQRDTAAAAPRTSIERVQSRDQKDALSFAGSLRLMPDAAAHDIHLRGQAKQVTTSLASTYGIKAVFDESVADAEPIRLDLDAVHYAEAMGIFLRLAHLFAVPLDAKSVFVAKDTQENRARLERQLEETVYVPGSTPEQLTELQNIIRNVFDVTKIGVQPALGSIFLRAPEPTINAINYVIKDLIDGAAEVSTEVKLVSVDRTHGRNTGLQTPTSAGAFNVLTAAQAIVSANQAAVNQAIAAGLYKPTGNPNIDIPLEAYFLVKQGLAQDVRFSNLIAILGLPASGIPNYGTTGIYVTSGVTLNLGINSSEARMLDDITIRSGDRQTATLRIGSKYPITTSTYSSGIDSATANALKGVNVNGVSASQLLNQYLGAGAATVPQVQYEDLGLTLKATPSVQKSGQVLMHVDLKIESLTGASANGIPVLTSRVFTSDITIPDGSTALMLSDLSKFETSAVSGIPGLSDLPGFRESAADTLTERDSSELALLITPHVVRHRSSIIATRPVVFVPTVPQDF